MCPDSLRLLTTALNTKALSRKIYLILNINARKYKILFKPSNLNFENKTKITRKNYQLYNKKRKKVTKNGSKTEIVTTQQKCKF
jgi:hypothetical protein